MPSATMLTATSTARPCQTRSCWLDCSLVLNLRGASASNLSTANKSAASCWISGAHCCKTQGSLSRDVCVAMAVLVRTHLIASVCSCDSFCMLNS
jgi:hypothetical protein